MTWQFRRADTADLERIMQLETSTFASDAWASDTMQSELASPNSWYLVAFRPETPEKLDAYAGLLAPPGVEDADIQTIAVAPEARRSGLGRNLMRALMNEAVKRGATTVFLEVRADNPAAQQLYATLGFEQIAVRPRYYQPDDVDAIVMRHFLTPREAALAAPEASSPLPQQVAEGDSFGGEDEQ